MSSSIKVLSRALLILHTLASKDESFSLAEITEITHLPKSTVHHILQGLEFEDAVKKVRPGYYAIGKSLIALGAKVVSGSIVFRAAPPMRRLRDMTDCTVYLTTLNKYETVYLHRVPGRTVTFTDNTSYAGDVFWTAGGRAILSTYSDEQIEKFFLNVKFQPRTQHSIRTKEKLLEEIKKTKQRGYAISANEYALGLESIGVPIFDYTGKCIAALSLLAVTGTLSVPVMDHLDLLLKTAKEISEMLGSPS